MKKFIYTLISCYALAACTTPKSESAATVAMPDSASTAKNVKAPTESAAVGIWDGVSVRATPSEEGQWLTSVSLGERLTYLNEEATDEKDQIYYKIRLNDGEEGWIRHEFIVPEAKPAVFLRETAIYERPALLTKSEKSFSKMDIVAVKQTQDDWIEVKGRRTGGKWIDTGWVKSDNISYELVDIAMAKFAKPVMETEDPAKKIEKLEEIVNNVDLSSSVFAIGIKETLDALKLKQEMQVKQPDNQAADSVVIENKI